jgi:hypothetical protein
MTAKEEYEALLATADVARLREAEENASMDAADLGFEEYSERYYRCVLNNYDNLA